MNPAFAQPGGQTESEQRRHHGRQIGRRGRIPGQPGAQDHPIQSGTVTLATLLPQIPDPFGIRTGRDQTLAEWADPADRIEVERTIIDRRNQSIGVNVRMARQAGIGSRTIDHDEIAAGRQFG